MKQLTDNRYDAIKVLITSGHITSFLGIFSYIPKTIVYRDLGVNFNRFSRAIHNPGVFKIDELIKLADMFNLDPRLMIDMALKQKLTIKYKAKRLKGD
jgi:hypothetical protein